MIYAETKVVAYVIIEKWASTVASMMLSPYQMASMIQFNSVLRL